MRGGMRNEVLDEIYSILYHAQNLYSLFAIRAVCYSPLPFYKCEKLGNAMYRFSIVERIEFASVITRSSRVLLSLVAVRFFFQPKLPE